MFRDAGESLLPLLQNRDFLLNCVRDKVLAVIAQLTAAGIPLENISAVERHQHNEAEEAVAHSVQEKTKA